ncbi:MAG: molybdopterin cofactor-binding domain-containing protein [Bilophila wadsworthia]
MLSYAEHQHTTGKRSPVYANVRLACDEAGKLTAMDFLAGIDHGAYSEMAGALTTKVCRFFGYPYAIPNIRGLVRTAFTNNNFGTAFRAFGSPQTYTASEQIVDMLAGRIGMDPFEFRYINVARRGCLHHVRPYREYPMQAMMDMLRPLPEGREKARSTPEHRRGVALRGAGITSKSAGSRGNRSGAE